MVVRRGNAAARASHAVTPDAAEIVAKLRAMAGPAKPNLLDEAADLIEQLQAELQERDAHAIR